MITKFNDSKDMGIVASDTIQSYIKDDYRIDARESIIDRDRDGKDCTFKAVLKKDANGFKYKTVITLTDSNDAAGNICVYNKVDTVGDIILSEESYRTYRSNINAFDNEQFEPLSDITKEYRESSHSKFGCKLPSVYSCLNDYIQFNSKNEAEGIHIKVNSDESESDIYRKIIDHKKNIEATYKSKEEIDSLPKQDEDIEDSLIKLVRYIFGK